MNNMQCSRVNIVSISSEKDLASVATLTLVALLPVLVVRNFGVHMVQEHAPRASFCRFQNASTLQMSHNRNEFLKRQSPPLIRGQQPVRNVALQAPQASAGWKGPQPRFHDKRFNGGQCVLLKVSRDGLV